MATKVNSGRLKSVSPEETVETTTENTVENAVEMTENESKVVFTEKSNDNNKVKQEMVEVALNCDHRCNIGGVWYNFVKGVSQKVPENVKVVLKNAGYLTAI